MLRWSVKFSMPIFARNVHIELYDITCEQMAATAGYIHSRLNLLERARSTKELTRFRLFVSWSPPIDSHFLEDVPSRADRKGAQSFARSQCVVVVGWLTSSSHKRCSSAFEIGEREGSVALLSKTGRLITFQICPRQGRESGTASVARALANK